MREGQASRTGFLRGDFLTKKAPKSILARARSNEVSVSARIGREGASKAFLLELSDQLKCRDLVKIKANKGATSDSKDRDEMFSEIASKTNSEVVFQRGNVAVLWSGK